MPEEEDGIGFAALIERAGQAMEGAGVAIIVLGAAIATVRFVVAWRRAGALDATYRDYRRNLGRAILLGLEFLIAGDIIRTVAIDPSFRSVGVLAIIVAIRTFLSLELELEIEGRWPWQRKEAGGQPAAMSPAPGTPAADPAPRARG